ncbi:MAG: mercury transporter MerT [Deltaproteobacteria bacterium]|nr:mercury transporter MerT [Deltaproteobacteria bacterium]
MTNRDATKRATIAGAWEGHGTGLSLATSAGSILTAFIASACCVGPLIFALLGIGGAGLLVAFEPYRPYFMALTFVLLGAGYYFTYGRPRTTAIVGGAAGSDQASCDCAAPRTNRTGRVMLWVATAAVLVFLALPYVLPLILE